MEGEVVATGMSGFITALTNSTSGLSASTFYGVLTDLVPFLVIIIPVSLGLYFVRKLIKGAAKAKVRM